MQDCSPEFWFWISQSLKAYFIMRPKCNAQSYRPPSWPATSLPTTVQFVNHLTIGFSIIKLVVTCLRKRPGVPSVYDVGI